MSGVTHVAFLRGINVGGHRTTNDQLRSLLAPLGFAAVATFQASGNLLLTAADQPDPGEMETAIATRLAEGLGYPVPTFVRTAEELAEIVRRDAFPNMPPGGKQHIALLRVPLSPDELAQITDLLEPTDSIAPHGRELHWHMATGRMLDSAIGHPAVIKLLGDRWTVRTGATLERIAART